MVDFIEGYFDGAKISFNGSMLDPGSIDIYSDVDIDIALSIYDPAIDIDRFINALSKQFCGIFGYEFHNNNSRDVLRLCLINGWRFDFTFIHQKPDKPQDTAEMVFIEKVGRTINQFWFMASMVLIKLGRNDYLIATHLVLELCQLIIVIQMLIRDEALKTNIHRFGRAEDVPILHMLVAREKPIDAAGNTKAEILDVLFLAATYMDDAASSILPEYTNKSNYLKLLYEMYIDDQY